ncbi:M13 family metallopeptidase [Croceicoccus bisphenolivorans]|uniref:M13 family metallopeptidase n=1 Tax=Croceicoccus bisphenolivorans TaxID=1783232 RepID=UPI000834F191|nr:M13 family metallopeptidase [Croceicoccus bisphenolivorans]
MMRIVLAAGCSALALACAIPAGAEETTDADTEQVVIEPDFMTWPDKVIDPADLDPAMDPGDDFADYVNGKWDAATEIPPQYTSYGVVRDMRLKAQDEVRKIVEQSADAHAPAGSFAQMVGDSYKAFLDTDAIEAKGLAPVQPWFAQIAKMESNADLVKVFTTMGMPEPMGIGVIPDPADTTVYTAYFGHGGYTLPDRDNYLVDNEKNRDMQAKQKEYQTWLLAQAGYADPAAAAEAVFQLERKLAEADYDRTLSRNPEITFRNIARKDLVAMAGKFPLQAYFDQLGVGKVETMLVPTLPPTPEIIDKLELTDEQLAKLGGGVPAFFELLRDTPIDTWKAWLTAQILSDYASILPKAFDDKNFAFFDTYLNGQKIQRTRDKRGLSLIDGRLGDAVGKLYIEKNFPPESKARMTGLVDNLLKAMDHRISSLDWMSAHTKEEAHTKLSQMLIRIGYSDKLETYEGMVVVPDDAFANSISAAEWGWNDSLKDIGQKVDDAEWSYPPQTVNATYNFLRNHLTFPAGYLQPPNFSLSADDAVNYGAIGVTIGHEISHGFDDNGSKFDGKGQMRNWWAPEDRAKFDAAAANLVEQFNAFCPIDDGKTCINGELTLGENIADLAGLTVAYEAYRISLNGKEPAKIDGLTGDQRFFISYALSSRGKWTDDFTRTILQTDPHSPDKARINIILANFDPWYKAFNVAPDDAMYIAPENRVRMW